MENPQLETIAERLAAVRGEMSSRDFSETLRRHVGLRVSHAAIINREDGAMVPAEYVAAVCVTFNISPMWLLLGRGARTLAEGQQPDQYVAGLQAAVLELESAVERLRTRLPTLTRRPAEPYALE